MRACACTTEARAPSRASHPGRRVASAATARGAPGRRGTPVSLAIGSWGDLLHEAGLLPLGTMARVPPYPRHLGAFANALGMLCMVACQPHARAATYTVDTSNGSAGDDFVTANGAVIGQFIEGSGSGTYVRVFGILKSGQESGYNYGGPGNKPFDQQTDAAYVPHVDLGDVVIKTIEGTNYLEFALDLTEPDNNLILEEFRVYLYDDPSDTPDDTYEVRVTSEKQLGTLRTLVWNLDAGGDNSVNMTFPAAGGADMAVHVPQNLFTSYNINDNLYIWMKFSGTDWATAEELVIDQLHGPTWYDLVPEPSTLWGGAGCAALALVAGVAQALRRRRLAPSMHAERVAGGTSARRRDMARRLQTRVASAATARGVPGA